MPRPLTAVDRVPQVGDVLFMRGKERPCLVVDVFTDEKGEYRWLEANRNVEYGYSCRFWWHYVSRADGGPVTIEEQG